MGSLFMQGNGHLILGVQYFMILRNVKIKKKSFYKLGGLFGESIKNYTLHSYKTYFKCV